MGTNAYTVVYAAMLIPLAAWLMHMGADGSSAFGVCRGVGRLRHVAQRGG